MKDSKFTAPRGKESDMNIGPMARDKDKSSRDIAAAAKPPKGSHLRSKTLALQ